MIIGIGTDIVELDRLGAHSKRKSFLEHVFTDEELKYARNSKDFVPHLATTFAAKEAIFKALGTGWLEGKEIEIIREKSGKPKAFLRGKLEKTFNVDIMLSMSCTDAYAVAFALLKEKEK